MNNHREHRIHNQYHREFDLIQQNYLSNKERLFNILDDSGRHHLVQLEQLEKELQDLEHKYNVDHREQEQQFDRQLQALRNENRVQTQQIKHVQDSKNMLSHTNQVLSQRVSEMAEQLEALLNKLHEMQVERDKDKQAIQSCSEKIENLCELLQIRYV
jgi:chromosome segregation ATPase